MSVKHFRKPLFLATLFALSCPTAWAAVGSSQMPGGGEVIATNSNTTVNGSGSGSTITGLQPGATISLGNPNGNTPYAVIRWGGTSAPSDSNPGGFNIGADASLTFSSPNGDPGAILNIDASGNPSEIDGALQGNNTAIYVANGNGIVIGSGARISLPIGGAFMAWNMDNTTAVQEFVGNNGSNTPELDIGSLSTPGNITIDNGAQITAGNARLLISGANIVNSGDISVGNSANSGEGETTITAGWKPIKGSHTVNGVSSTATYRVTQLGGGSMDSSGLRNFEPGTSAGFSGTFTNDGTITSSSGPNYGGRLAILSQSGLANFGTLKTVNQGIEIYNTYNDVALNGTIEAPSTSYDTPGESYVTGGDEGANRSWNTYTEGLLVVDPYAKILLGDTYNIDGKTIVSSSNVAAGSMALVGYDIQSLNGSTPISANYLELASTANINAPGGSSYLDNGLGVQPYTSGQAVQLQLLPEGPAVGNYNVVNIKVNGNAVVSSLGQTPVAQAIENGFWGPNDNNYHTPGSTDSSGNYGTIPAGSSVSYSDPTSHASSMLLQATGSMTVTGNPHFDVPFKNSYESMYNNTFGGLTNNLDYYMTNTSPFAFAGGIVLDAAGPLTVNIPMINVWGSNPGVPFQGFYLEGQSIQIANDAWFMENYRNVVNVSTTPTGNSTGSYVPNVYWMSGGVSNPPSALIPSSGTAVYYNAYTTTEANAAKYPDSWASMQNNTPLQATQ